MSIYSTAVLVSTRVQNLNLGSHVQPERAGDTGKRNIHVQKVKLSLCIPWRRVEGMEVQQYAFLILALHACWVVTFTLQPFYLLVPIELAAGCDPAPV